MLTALTDSYNYTPYGKLSNHDGESENGFLFTGEQLDSETDNYYLRARYYNPDSTRFLTRDSYDGVASNPVTQNHYLYAHSNPLFYTDPSGYMSYAEQTSVLAVQSILAGVAVVNANAIFGSRGEYGGNINLMLWAYNAKVYVYEEFTDIAIYMAGKAKSQSPFKDREKEALDTTPNDPCSFIKTAIKILEAQIAWRYTDLRPRSTSYKGHLKRIKILQKHLEKLKGAYNAYCKQ